MKLNLIFFLAALVVASGIYAQEDTLKRLYLANDTHTDLMWNGTEEQWARWTIEMSEFYLPFTERTASKPVDSQVKWNYDMAWCLYILENKTDPEFFSRVINQIRNQQGSVPYNFTLSTYGGFKPETILRRFYYGGYLERKYGIGIEMANAIESSVIPLGLASLWAGAGAKYSWKGVCNCATKIDVKGDRDHEIYWYTGLDGSRILMKWYSMYGPNAELGGYSETLDPRLAIKQMDALCGSERYPYNIAGAFSKGWDNGRNFSIDFHAMMKSRALPGTKVYISNEVDFFRDFEATYGDILPSETLAYGNEWDLYPASLPAATSQMRRSMEKLRTAEALAAIADRAKPGRYADLNKLKEEFYYGLSVYGLHGWTADGTWVSRDEVANWARQQQHKVTLYVDTLHARALNDLGSLIPAGHSKHRYFVFNSLNYERKGFVEISNLPDKPGLMKNLTTGELNEIYITKPENENFRTGTFMSGEIPGTGYQVYEWVEDTRTAAEVREPFTVERNRIVTPYYIITITPDGAITSLKEKKTNKEWVASVLNQFGPGKTAGTGDSYISENTIEEDQIRVVLETDEVLEIKCESSEPLEHVTLIRLYATNPRIDIENTITENFPDPLYCKFDLDVDLPEVWHEEVGAVIKAKLHSNGGHYAERKARYDHLSFNHFVWVGNQTGGMVISNRDCQFFKLGESEPSYLDESSSTIHALVGGMVDDNLGIYSQGGDSLFYVNFGLRPFSGGFNQTKAMKFALDQQNPLVAGKVSGERRAPFQEEHYTMLTVSDPDILLWAAKPGEEGGTVLRFWNMGGYGDVLIRLNTKPVSAYRATHVETLLHPMEIKDYGFSTFFRQQQMSTFWFD
ncbi:MAG: hypothetical protein K9J30_02715 [Bacteroidales bacterium]|nr:hypothetical protein [Bacteroidales bacterium]